VKFGNFTEILLEFHWSFTGVSLEFHWKFSQTSLFLAEKKQKKLQNREKMNRNLHKPFRVDMASIKPIKRVTTGIPY